MKCPRILILLTAGLLPWPTLAEPVRLEVDAGASQIAAHVRATGHSFDAVVTAYDLDLRWDREAGRIQSARLRFNFADVKTGNARRDREMLQWLSHDRHPAAEFVLDSLETDAAGATRARGGLTFHQKSREVIIPVTITREGGGVRIQGKTTLDHRDWGLPQIRALLFMTVNPELDVAIDIRAAMP